MNLYLSVTLIILFTSVTFFLHLSEAAISSANISRVKQLEEENDKKAVNLAHLRFSQKPVFNATVRALITFCTFAVSVLTLTSIYPRLSRVLVMWWGISEASANRLSLVCSSVFVLSFYLIILMK